MRVPFAILRSVFLLTVACAGEAAEDPLDGLLDEDVGKADDVGREVRIRAAAGGRNDVLLFGDVADTVFGALAEVSALEEDGDLVVVRGTGVACVSDGARSACLVDALDAGRAAGFWFFYDFGSDSGPRSLASAFAASPGVELEPPWSFRLGRVRCTRLDPPSLAAPDTCHIFDP